MAPPTICAVDGCEKPARTRGWCEKHYGRWYRHGDPCAGRRPQDMTLDEILDAAVAKAKPDQNGCLIAQEWIGAQGYAVVQTTAVRDTIPRLLLERKLGRPLRKGPPKIREMARHTCDVRACINEEHLVVGTAADNSQDALERNRYPLGEARKNAKLSEGQVREIRWRYANVQPRPTMAVLAADYGITRHAVGLIIRRKRWSHIP